MQKCLHFNGEMVQSAGQAERELAYSQPMSGMRQVQL